MKHRILSIIVVVLSFVSFTSLADVARTIAITSTNTVSGIAKSLELTLGSTTETNSLFVAYGSADMGDDIDAWEHLDPICITTPETNTIHYTLPDSWGSEIMALRFFLAKGVIQNYDYEVEYLTTTTGDQCLRFSPMTFTYLTTTLMQASVPTVRTFIIGTGSYCWYTIETSGKFPSGNMAPIGTPFTMAVTNDNGIGKVYINGSYDGNIQANSSYMYKFLNGVDAFYVGGTYGREFILGRIYKTTIYNGDEMLINAIPCVTNGVACFYDTVNRVFYRQDGYLPGPAVGFIRNQDNCIAVSSSETFKSGIIMTVASTIDESVEINPPVGVYTEAGDYSASAITEIGDYRYTCSGYTLEEYINNEWITVENSSAHLYSCPNDGVPRRLTWNWALTHYKVNFDSLPAANGSTILSPDIDDRFYPVDSELTLTPVPNQGAYHTGYYIISHKEVAPDLENSLYRSHREGPITITLECPKTITSYYASGWGIDGEYLTNGVWKFTISMLTDGINLTGYSAGHGMLDFRNVESDTGYKVVQISGGVFRGYYYKGLTSCFAPDVYQIGERAFQYAYSLEHIELSPNLISLASCTFCDVYALTNLVPNRLPKLTSISGDKVFRSTWDFNVDLELDSCVSVAAEGFMSTGITSIKLPMCTSLGSKAFSDCSDLTNVVVHAKTLGTHTFINVSTLESITFTNPDGVEGFPNYTFRYGNSLKDIWYHGTNAPSSIGTEAFRITPTYPKIHVKNNADLEGWKLLATRLAESSTIPLTTADKARSDYPGRRTVGLRNASNNNFWIVKWPVSLSTLFMVE